MTAKIQRWNKAQKAEAAAWETRPGCWSLSEEQRRTHIERMCTHARLSREELCNMHVLEIGGATVERAFDEPSIALKLSLDPLFPFDWLVGHRGKCCSRVRGIGEHLPLSRSAIDLCWCANTIDHTLYPADVLKEIWRVLHSGGMLVISCDLFPGWARLAFPLLGVLDKPHPHHFTASTFRTLLEENFNIQEEHVESTLRPSLRQGFKANIGAVFGVKYVYFVCTPMRPGGAGEATLEECL